MAYRGRTWSSRFPGYRERDFRSPYFVDEPKNVSARGRRSPATTKRRAHTIGDQYGLGDSGRQPNRPSRFGVHSSRTSTPMFNTITNVTATPMPKSSTPAWDLENLMIGRRIDYLAVSLRDAPSSARPDEQGLRPIAVSRHICVPTGAYNMVGNDPFHLRRNARASRFSAGCANWLSFRHRNGKTSKRTKHAHRRQPVL